MLQRYDAAGTPADQKIVEEIPSTQHPAWVEAWKWDDQAASMAFIWKMSSRGTSSATARTRSEPKFEFSLRCVIDEPEPHPDVAGLHQKG